MGRRREGEKEVREDEEGEAGKQEGRQRGRGVGERG